MQTLVTPSQGCSTQNLALIGQVVSEEKSLKMVDDDDVERRMPEHGYTISSPMSLWLSRSGERKSQLYILFINVKMPTVFGILTLMSKINFMHT